jgi:glycosyltransferase involved in cell wall biosynthesis
MEPSELKLLILSFYFTPDIGPGPLRAKAMVDALVAAGDTRLEIEVLTTQPNRYRSLNNNAPTLERLGNVTITRFWLPEHKSGMVDQAISFRSFASQVLKNTKGKQWDVVIATSSRLMTAALGAWLARRGAAELYLDIRDLFTDTMEDVLSKSAFRALIPAFKMIEAITFRSAKKINVVSAGFAPHVSSVAPTVALNDYTNGIDEEFLTADFCSTQASKVPLILYAGNIGDGQGLHRVIPEVASLMKEQAEFRLIGDGGKRPELKAALVQQGITNVALLDPMPREGLFEQYRSADILFLHLNDYQAFHKVLPSKIFEYAATGKPILAGVGGYAAEFLREKVPGVAVFEPCDPAAMQRSFQRLLDGPRMIDRGNFCARYLRKSIMREMARDILALGGGK